MLKPPSNFIWDWNNEEALDKYDWKCSEAIGRAYALLYSDNHPTTIEWAKGVTWYRIWWETLEDVIKELRAWKTADLKNWWKSITINNNPILSYDHLKLPLTIDWDGIIIAWKYNTYILCSNQPSNQK